MPNDPRKVAESYDDIVRRTVVDPVGSVPPSKQQVQRAYEGERVLDADEQALHAKVADALAAVAGVDLATVDIEIDRDRVSLRGTVADAQMLTRIEDAVAEVEGVGAVDNDLVVAVS